MLVVYLSTKHTNTKRHSQSRPLCQCFIRVAMLAYKAEPVPEWSKAQASSHTKILILTVINISPSPKPKLSDSRKAKRSWVLCKTQTLIQLLHFLSNPHQIIKILLNRTTPSKGKLYFLNLFYIWNVRCSIIYIWPDSLQIRPEMFF